MAGARLHGVLFAASLAGCVPAPKGGDGASGSTSEGTGAAGGSDGGSDGATGGTPAGCECFESDANDGSWTCDPGVECGTHVAYGDSGGQDPCRDELDPTGGTAPECEQYLADEAALADCVMQSAGAGEAFHFARHINPGNIYANYDDYWARPGEQLAMIREVFQDLCDDFYAELRDMPAFEDCAGLPGPEAWSCIEAAVTDATLSTTCAEWDHDAW